MLCYCDKCGCITDLVESELNDKCYCCGSSPQKPIPKEYIKNFRWRDGDGKESFIEEVIKKSPNLDQYLFEHHQEIIKQKNDDMETKMAIGKAVLNGADPKKVLKGDFSVVKCPFCNSAKVSKVSIFGRAVSIGIFGLASNRIGKTHKCNNCGSTW